MLPEKNSLNTAGANLFPPKDTHLRLRILPSGRSDMVSSTQKKQKQKKTAEVQSQNGSLSKDVAHTDHTQPAAANYDIVIRLTKNQWTSCALDLAGVDR